MLYPGKLEIPSLNMPVHRLKVATLPLDLPFSGPVTHSGDILTNGKSHGKSRTEESSFLYLLSHSFPFGILNQTKVRGKLWQLNTFDRVPRCSSSSTLFMQFHVVHPVPRCSSSSTLFIQFHAVHPVPRCSPSSTLFIQYVCPYIRHVGEWRKDTSTRFSLLACTYLP